MSTAATAAATPDNDGRPRLDGSTSTSRGNLFASFKERMSFRRSRSKTNNNNSSTRSNMMQSFRSSLPSFRKKSQKSMSMASKPDFSKSFSLVPPKKERSPDWPLDRLLVGDYASKVVTVQASPVQSFEFDICGVHQGDEHSSRRLKERRTLVALCVSTRQWKLCRVRQYDVESDSYQVVWEDGTSRSNVAFGSELVVPTVEQSKQLEARLLAVARRRREEEEGDDENEIVVNAHQNDSGENSGDEEEESSNLTQSSTVCEEDEDNDNNKNNNLKASITSSIGSVGESVLRLLVGGELAESLTRSGSVRSIKPQEDEDDDEPEEEKDNAQ